MVPNCLSGCRYSIAVNDIAAISIWAVSWLAVLISATGAIEPTKRDIQYAVVADKPLLLDLYLPQTPATNRPLIVWVHGGAWRAGSKQDVPIIALLNDGYAIASVDYRLSATAKFPAQVHDIKAAIRFLRASSNQYQLNRDRFFVAGSSAGGHLAALVGVTNQHQPLEGTLGEHLNQSSKVSAIVSFYGGSNLQSILSQSTPHGLKVRVPALELLLGGQPEQQSALARLASPVAHVDQHDPPLFLIHGDQDPQMPINQAHELHGAYKQNRLVAKFEVVHGGAHGGKEFFEAEMIARVAQFLREVSTTP